MKKLFIKQSRNKVAAALTSLILALVLLSCGNNREQPVQQPAQFVQPPNTELVLTVHYYRFDGNYTGWNLWSWPYGGNGQGYLFDIQNPDEYGFVTTQVYFDVNAAAIKEKGVIIRRSESGNDWAEKDITQDRFTESNEIWLVQNDPTVYTEKPDIGEPPVLFAAADSSNTVVFTLLREPADYSVFAVYDGQRRLAGVSRKSDDSGTGSPYKAVITLSDRITDPSKLYTLRDESGGYAECNITMRNILDAFFYGGDDLGLTYSRSQSGFKVWSPGAVSISVALYDNAGTYNAAGKVTNHETSVLYPMTKDSNTGVWSAVVSGDLAGKYYMYRVTFADGTATWAADPYARAVSANGQRMAIVNLTNTNPSGWTPNSKPPFTAGAWQDAVIYELHVRDFSIDENSGMKNKGKFLAFTERGTVNSSGAPTGVDHLVKLGITHVHLLPSYDFASLNELTVDDPASSDPKFNWGYDPMHYNVPDGSYSSDPRNPVARITEFKAMVQSLHNAGIRVVMDVVYNHTYETGTYPFDAIVPGYYYRMTDTGAYANGSGCGNEV
ncbi:MAG: hypothetical protein LBI14_00055, partial [Treponema sp.]|nr:hypothetical protein [Treponema sp.]